MPSWAFRSRRSIRPTTSERARSGCREIAHLARRTRSLFVLGRFVNGTGSGVGAGLLYGGAWWILGPLTLMPLFMGMGFGVNWNAAAAVAMLPSLVGHLMYGGVLGVVYVWLRHRDVDPVLATAA